MSFLLLSTESFCFFALNMYIFVLKTFWAYWGSPENLIMFVLRFLVILYPYGPGSIEYTLFQEYLTGGNIVFIAFLESVVFVCVFCPALDELHE